MKRAVVFSILTAFLFIYLGSTSAAEKRIEIKRSFSLKKGGKVEIDLDTGGDVRISGGSRNEAELQIYVEGDDKENVDIEIEGGNSGLSIKSEFKEKRRRNRCDVLLVLKTPFEVNVDVKTLGGDLELDNIKGEIAGKTMGGDVDLSRIEGVLDIETMGGDIFVEKSKVGGKVHTMGGDVEVKDVEGDLKSSTMGGDINYRGKPRGKRGADEEMVKINTMGGDLDLDYPGQRVKAKTFGGDIDVPQARSMDVVTMGGDIEGGRIEDGAKAKTMGGDIEIDYAGGYADVNTMGGDIILEEVEGWIKAKTMGGDIYAKMTGDPDRGNRSVELTSMGGDIELNLPEGISAVFDIEIEYTRSSKQNYRIDSDFDLDVEEDEEWDDRLFGRDVKKIRGKGSSRNGEHEIRIRTVNGNVIIKKN